MIALDTKAPVGKSPKEMHVETEEDSEQDSEHSEMESENGTMGSEEELESADENLAGSESEDTDAKDESDDGDESQTGKSGNPGWADAMQKILRTSKPKRKKSIVLSKAKKLCDVVKKEKEEPLPFEIDRVKDEVKTETEEKTVPKVQAPVKHKRKDNLGIRVKPSISDRERERMLQRIATKGVVQLFNVVRQQQTQINKKLTDAGPLERKREKVLKNIDKRAFLDVLMGGTKSIQVDNDVKEETEKKTSTEEKNSNVWSVLRDDFVMGAKLKDWDKKDEEEDSSAPEDMDSDN